MDSIIKCEKQNKVFLLNGITGSGKTEVYLQAIQEIIKKGKQALILIPEIGLAPQAEDRFKQYFGERVLSFHSAKNDREKIDAWLGASKGLIDTAYQFTRMDCQLSLLLILHCNRLLLIVLQKTYMPTINATAGGSQ